MMDQLSAVAAEVTRVAREVGTEGKLSGQAKVKGVAGTWKDLTDSVNSMAGNLTGQLRNIAEVTTAVANGACPLPAPFASPSSSFDAPLLAPSGRPHPILPPLPLPVGAL